VPRHPNARGATRTPNKPTRREPSERAEVGVVFVHGIGNQEPGSLLEKWAQPCADALGTLGESRGFVVKREREPSATAAEPQSMMLCLGKAGRVRRVLLTEAIWSDSFQRPPWWRSVIWAVRSLPAVVLLFAPDHRDAALLEDDVPVSFGAELRGQFARHFRGHLVGASERVALRLVYRVFTGVLLIGLLLVAIAEYHALAVLLAVAMVAYLASARNVVGHIVVAASEASELERIRSRVRGCIDWTLDRCDRVLVVAHSQGGFVCHSILATAAEPSPPKGVRGLIGVGSGLKPIWLLKQLSNSKIAAAVWITTIATAIGEASIFSLLSGTDPSLTAAAKGLIDLGALAALPVAAVSAVSVREALSGIESIPLIGLPDSFRHPGGLPIFGLAAFFSGWLIARRAWTVALANGVEARPRAIKARRWIELSSYHDPVGRLLFPPLPPPATENAVAVGGHPIRDHIAYFRRSSVLPWMVASEVFKTMKIRPQREIALATAALQLSAERRRLLRSGLFVAVLIGGTLPLVASGRPLFAAIASLGVVLLGVSLVLSLTFLALETRANRRVLAALQTGIRDGTPFQLPRLPVPPAKRRAPACVAFGMSVLTFCVIFALADYPSREQGSAGEFVLLTALFATYCAAIVAGYRPSRWLLVLLAYSAIVHYLNRVPPLPHAASISDAYAVPAVPAIFAVICGVCLLVVLMRPKRYADHTRQGTTATP
jgi:hypothetical protein